MSFTPVTKYDLTNDELDFLRDLTKQGTKFLLVGMLAAIFQGADGITRDIDLSCHDDDHANSHICNTPIENPRHIE
jgi:hypothetical protein